MRIERNKIIGMGIKGIIIELNGRRSLCDWYRSCIQAMYRHSGWREQDHVKWE